jgi:hypothetical protein
VHVSTSDSSLYQTRMPSQAACRIARHSAHYGHNVAARYTAFLDGSRAGLTREHEARDSREN